MPNLRGSEWLIIILLVVLLFGAKRLPDAARSIGRSLRIFKAETKGLAEESGQAPAEATSDTSTTPAPAAPVAPAQIASAPAAPAAPAEPTAALQPQADDLPGALQPQPPSQA